MKDLIYQQTNFLMYFFFVYAFFLLMISFLREYKLKHRSKINYERFIKYSKYFYLQIKNSYLFLGGLFYFLTTIYAFILIENEFLRVYIFVLIALDILVLLGLLLHVTSINYNKDLSLYKNYHRIIHESFANRDKLANQMKSLEKTYRSLIDTNKTISFDLAKFSKNGREINNLDETLLPLVELIKSYQNQYDSFDLGITVDFDRVLASFLITEIHTSLSIEEFKFIDTRGLQKILDYVKDDRNKRISDYVLTIVRDNDIPTNEVLMVLITKIEALGITISDNLVIEFLNYAYQHQNKDQILELFVNKKLINVNVLCNFIHVKDWSWIYDTPLHHLIDDKDAFKVFQSLIQTNASNCAFKVLTSTSNNYVSSIKKALEVSEDNNETKKMFVVFNDIFGNDHFYNKAIKHENMAVVLDQYFAEYNENDKEVPKVKEIVKNQAFEDYAQYIESTYHRIKDGYKDLYLNTVNTLFIYSSSKISYLDYIDYEKVLELYSELRKNLSINEIKILDILLKTLILMNEDDQDKIKRIYPTLDEAIKNIPKKSLSGVDLEMEKRRYVGSANLKYLTNKNNIQTFKKVLNRIEKERLVLDKIVKL